MGTMALTTVIRVEKSGAMKRAWCLITGSGSYATGGDTMPDCSTAGTLSSEGFQTVLGITKLATAAANSKYELNFVRGASDSPTAGLVKIHDQSAAADAEVTNATDLSSVTFTVEIVGS